MSGDNPNTSLSSIIGAGGFTATGGGGGARPRAQAPSSFALQGQGGLPPINFNSTFGSTLVMFPKPGTYTFNMKCKDCGRTGSTPLIMPGGGPMEFEQPQPHGSGTSAPRAQAPKRAPRAGPGPRSKKEQQPQPQP